MFFELLKNGAKTVVGVKQTQKAIASSKAKMVLIAVDADEHVTAALVKACLQNQVPCEKGVSMQELGKACGIHVGAAAAAILND
jgi:large subunit ribosomal protein L7A